MKKALRSYIIIFSVITNLILLFSCSNSQESKLVYTESNTIKRSVKEKELEITWTQELEGERLSKKITRGSMELGPDVLYDKELFKIQTKQPAPVYPSISEFGSLDTSRLRTSVKNKLDDFCTAFFLVLHTGAASFFSSKYIFNYVFFMTDLEADWSKNFGKKLPEEGQLFTKWIYGEPFNGADIIQIPVRFYADCGTIDVTVFLNSTGNNEFYQITIDRWKKV